jgi:hypothetical protein
VREVIPNLKDLQQLVADASMRSFGYVDEYPPYRIVYPWLLTRLLQLRTGSRLLDLGAGINPLPLALAGAGMYVDCVDSSAVIRELPVTDEWNGWGFFDYRVLHPNLRSFQCRAEEFTYCSYDGIYCAGMLAHQTCDARGATIAKCAGALSDSAPLLAYIDLIPGTDYIWNRCDGKDLEPPERHGTVVTVTKELEAAGLSVIESDVYRGIPGAHTDILLLHAAGSCYATGL